MSFFKNLLGLGPKVDFAELMEGGALILDVRTSNEYKSGHIKGSKNIAVQELDSRLSKLNKDQVIITCCASGMRSGKAANMLKASGFEAYNGGPWNSLESKL